MQFSPHSEWQRVLTDILATAEASGPAGVVAFDLDSTLLDNRPRQAAIVRDFGTRHGIAALEAFQPEHFVTGFDTREALGRAGLDADAVTRWLPELGGTGWSGSSPPRPACTTVPVRGAAAYARRAHATGVQLVYLTARPERMRPGTEEVLRRFGFPLPGPGVQLWMKPDDPSIADEAFKRSAHTRLASLGRLVAAFDNEPGHVNDFRETFPEAEVVLVATGHSGRVSTLAPRVRVVPNFHLEPDSA
jgi:hypothetical protein